MKKFNEILKKYYLFFIVALMSCLITIFINSSTSMAYTPQQLYDQVWKLVNTKYVDQTNNDQSWASWRHKYDNEINEIVFKNSYVPIGLMIGNVNNSDYVDKDKVYSYSLTLEGATGSYDVLDIDSNVIDAIG